MQNSVRNYNEQQLALVQQITKASRSEIIASVQLAQVKLEEIIQCHAKTKKISSGYKNAAETAGD